VDEMAFGLGIMGLGLDCFLDLTPFEFITIKGKYLEQQHELQKERWEIARWQVFRTVCPPQSKSKRGLLGVKDFILFPWEKKEPDKKLQKADPEHVKRLIEKWK